VSVVIHDEPIAHALGVLPWRDMPIRRPDGALLGRFHPAHRSWKTVTADDAGWATGEEVLALLRELSRIPRGFIGQRCLNLENAALALLLAESDADGIPLHDPDGKLLGHYIPEPRPGRDEPHVVNGDPDANDEG
jgi:hypothetical protein